MFLFRDIFSSINLKRHRIIVVQYEAPKNLSPIEASMLLRRSLKKQDVIAELIYLANEGYISIDRTYKKGIITKNVDYTLTLKKTPADLPNFQWQLLEGVFGTVLVEGRTVKLFKSGKRIKSVFGSVRKEVKRRLVQNKYYTKNFSRFLLLGQKTEKGLLAKNYVLGLMEYIKVAEKDRLEFHHTPGDNPKLFQELLPYAIMFGFENKWGRVFASTVVGNPHWYQGNDSAFNTNYLSSSLRDFSRILFSRQ